MIFGYATITTECGVATTPSILCPSSALLAEGTLRAPAFSFSIPCSIDVPHLCASAGIDLHGPRMYSATSRTVQLQHRPDPHMSISVSKCSDYG